MTKGERKQLIRTALWYRLVAVPSDIRTASFTRLLLREIIKAVKRYPMPKEK